MSSVQVLRRKSEREVGYYYRQGHTAATFFPTAKPFRLKVILLNTAGSAGNATMVPAVSLPIIAGNVFNGYKPDLRSYVNLSN